MKIGTVIYIPENTFNYIPGFYIIVKIQFSWTTLDRRCDKFCWKTQHEMNVCIETNLLYDEDMKIQVLS